MKRNTRSFVWNWVPVFAWMLVIFGASTDVGSAAHTARFLVPFLLWINPAISPATVQLIELLVRKSAHLSEYAVLALLLIRALHGNMRVTFARGAFIALAIAAAYASSDEFHQTFVSSRTPSIIDVMIDCLGAAFGITIYRLLTLAFPPREVVRGQVTS